MGIFDNLPGFIKISDKPFFNLGGVLNGIINKYSGAGLTPAEKESNAFTAEREDIAWQREMDASNTQYQRSVADMQAAGINPMMAAKGSGAAVPTATAGSSVTPGSANLGELFSAILGFKRFGIDKMIADKQAKVLEEEARNKAADTANKEQNTAESASRQKSIDLDNLVKEYTQQQRIESAKLDNDLKKANRDLIYGKLDEAIANTQLLIKKAKTEEEQAFLVQAEKVLRQASAWQIYQLTPSIKALNEANTEASKAAASASLAKAAYDNGLINAGYINAVVKKAFAEAGSAVDRRTLDDINTAVRTGDWSNIHLPGETSSSPTVLQSIMSGLALVFDNFNPLDNILK